jgi:hypothetical protein
MKKSETHQIELNQLKNKIITDINEICKKFIVPGEPEEVELPNRVPVSVNNEIIAVYENCAIYNSFHGPVVVLREIPIEILILVLIELEKTEE